MALLSLVTCCNNPKLRLSTKERSRNAKPSSIAEQTSKVCKELGSSIHGCNVSLIAYLQRPSLSDFSALNVHFCNALSSSHVRTPVSLGFFHAAVSLAQTVDIQKGASLFRQACIGCHDGGGNVIQPGATLFLKDLQRNGVDTEDEIYHVTYFGKGRMPGFGEKCTPRGQCTFGARLQDEDIKLLAQFVKSQADQGWPKIESMED
ncbi:cytochrome c6 [Citrus sinensis]|nr:cytochrome c6 [Citrus sinensis]